MKEIIYTYHKGKGWVAAYEIPYTKLTRQEAKKFNFGTPAAATVTEYFFELDLAYNQWTRTRR